MAPKVFSVTGFSTSFSGFFKVFFAFCFFRSGTSAWYSLSQTSETISYLLNTKTKNWIAKLAQATIRKFRGPTSGILFPKIGSKAAMVFAFGANLRKAKFRHGLPSDRNGNCWVRSQIFSFQPFQGNFSSWGQGWIAHFGSNFTRWLKVTEQWLQHQVKCCWSLTEPA